MAEQAPTIAKNATVEKEVVVENATNEVKHFMKKGVVAVGDTQYEIANGKVQVAPEHEALINEHISMIKG